MTSLLIALLVVICLPLFVATWRTSLLGLSLQGLLMAWLVFRHGAHVDVDSALSLVDLVFVRGLLVPLVLYRILRRQHAPRRNDVIPANMLSWTLVCVLVVLAFRLGGRLSAHDPAQSMHLAVAAAAVLLGFFVLATQTGTFSQVVGALRLENGIALFELAGHGHGGPVGIRAALLAVFALTALVYASYVRALAPGATLVVPERPPL